jgi:hypothetical protein
MSSLGGGAEKDVKEVGDKGVTPKRGTCEPRIVTTLTVVSDILYIMTFSNFE